MVMIGSADLAVSASDLWDVLREMCAALRTRAEFRRFSNQKGGEHFRHDRFPREPEERGEFDIEGLEPLSLFDLTDHGLKQSDWIIPLGSYAEG